MNIKAYDKFVNKVTLNLSFFNGQESSFTIHSTTLNEVLSSSDFLTIHIPKLGKKAIINEEKFNKMKDGVIIINAARGGVVSEQGARPQGPQQAPGRPPEEQPAQPVPP